MNIIYAPHSFGLATQSQAKHTKINLSMILAAYRKHSASAGENANLFLSRNKLAQLFDFPIGVDLIRDQKNEIQEIINMLDTQLPNINIGLLPFIARCFSTHTAIIQDENNFITFNFLCNDIGYYRLSPPSFDRLLSSYENVTLLSYDNNSKEIYKVEDIR